VYRVNIISLGPIYVGLYGVNLMWIVQGYLALNALCPCSYEKARILLFSEISPSYIPEGSPQRKPSKFPSHEHFNDSDLVVL